MQANSHTERASIGNIYSQTLPKTSHAQDKTAHMVPIKHPIRPHPIISESTSSLTSRYKTLTHLGVREHTPRCNYSSSNRVVYLCLLLGVYLLSVSSADGGFTCPGAYYWPLVTVPVSCVKSITDSWARYWRTLQEQWYGERNTVALREKKQDKPLQATQLYNADDDYYRELACCCAALIETRCVCVCVYFCIIVRPLLAFVCPESHYTGNNNATWLMSHLCSWHTCHPPRQLLHHG